MKTLSITVPDETFDKFTAIQQEKAFNNQSDVLIYIVKQAFDQLKKEKNGGD